MSWPVLVQVCGCCCRPAGDAPQILLDTEPILCMLSAVLVLIAGVLSRLAAIQLWQIATDTTANERAKLERLPPWVTHLNRRQAGFAKAS